MSGATKAYGDLEFRGKRDAHPGDDIEIGSLDGQELILFSNTPLDEGGYGENGISVCYMGPDQLRGKLSDKFFYGAEELFSGSAADFAKFMLRHPMAFEQDGAGQWAMAPAVLDAWRRQKHIEDGWASEEEFKAMVAAGRDDYDDEDGE